MKKTLTILSIFAIITGSYGQRQTTIINDGIVIHDTVVIKCINVLNESLNSIYSKSYSYYWLTGKDTLDFFLNVTEYKEDSSLHINVRHKEPIFFTVALEKINECLPLINEDFNIVKFSSIFFKEPVYYLDLAKKLSSEYEQEFGQKNINHKTLNHFLLKSSLTLQLNSFLNPLGKNVKRYGIEKFHLMTKKHYEQYLYDNERLSNIDFTEYPEFTVNGRGVLIIF